MENSSPKSFLVDKPAIEEVLDLNTGEILSATDVVGGDYAGVIRQRLSMKQGNQNESPVYACALCVVPVHLVRMPTRNRFYFRHEVEDGRCPFKTKGQLSAERILAMKYDGARESFLHIRMKEIIAASLRADPDFSDVRIEQVWKGEAANSYRRPDVRATWRSRVAVAFEIQLSTTFLGVIAARRAFYQQEGALLLWVFSSFASNEALLTQDDIFYNNNRNAFVASEATLDLCRRERRFMIDCIWSEPLLKGAEVVWTERRRLVAFNELTIEQKAQRIYLFDSDRAENECVDQARRLPEMHAEKLRADFRSYWLRESRTYDEPTWQSLRARFGVLGFDLPYVPGWNYDLLRFLDTLFSAQAGHPVGWGHSNLVKVAHHVFDQCKGQLWAFKLMLSAHQRAAQFRVDDPNGKWRDKVRVYRAAWAANDKAYDPDRRFDHLIGFLFPEIAGELPSDPY